MPKGNKGHKAPPTPQPPKSTQATAAKSTASSHNSGGRSPPSATSTCTATTTATTATTSTTKYAAKSHKKQQMELQQQQEQQQQARQEADRARRASWSGKTPLTLLRERCDRLRVPQSNLRIDLIPVPRSHREYSRVRGHPAAHQLLQLLQLQQNNTGSATVVSHSTSSSSSSSGGGSGVSGSSGCGVGSAAATLLCRASLVMPDKSIVEAIPPVCSSNVQEARHAAAVALLFKLRSDVPLHQLIAPEFREIWFQLEAEKKEQDLALKQKEAAEMAALAAIPQKTHAHKHFQVFMSEQARTAIEAMAKATVPSTMTASPTSPEHAAWLARVLTRMGFSPIHAEQASSQCNSVSTALDWLCLNLPEEALPKRFEAGNSPVVIVPKSTTPPPTRGDQGRNHSLDILQKELSPNQKIAMNILSRAGFSHAVIATCCKQSESIPNIICSAFYLSGLSVPHGNEENGSVSSSNQNANLVNNTLFTEEIEALRAIYGDSVNTLPSVNVYCSLKLPITKVEAWLHSVVGPDCAYPQSPPVVIFESSNLPPAQCFFITSRISKKTKELVGALMLYELITWLENDFDRILLESSNRNLATAAPVSLSAPLSTGTTVEPPKTEIAPQPTQPSQNSSLVSLVPNVILPSDIGAMLTVMPPSKRSLPANLCCAEILSTIANSQVTIIQGHTGCGKSTQIPQMLLDSAKLCGASIFDTVNIVATQPRRIAAMGIAERVASERGEEVGGCVGYQIRLLSRASKRTKLLFCTTGVLLRKLQNPEYLSRVTHIIVDEVHERDIDTDFLLLLLKRVLTQNHALRVVLMSATVDISELRNYFCGAQYLYTVRKACGISFSTSTSLNSTGDAKHTEPGVQSWKRERVDLELVEKVILWCTDNNLHDCGSILVFLPGMADIIALQRKLSIVSKLFILPLHSSLSTERQQRIFLPAPPGLIKVILSTNIAESSITIDDTTVVIDTGRANVVHYNSETHISTMIETWISLSSAKQRMGRAGRLRPGKCIQLFAPSKLVNSDLPEILRAPIESLCLSVMKLALGGSVAEVLLSAPTPPSIAAITGSMNFLREIAAVNCGSDSLTPLGHHLALLPVDPLIGKMLIFGVVLGCTDATLTMAASLSVSRSIFLSSIEKRASGDKARITLAGCKSDSIVNLRLYNGWLESRLQRKDSDYISKNGLSVGVLKEIFDTRKQLATLMADIGFLDPVWALNECVNAKSTASNSALATHNRNGQDLRTLRAVVCAGLYPNVVRVDAPLDKFVESRSGAVLQNPLPQQLKFVLQTRERVFLHPQSVNFVYGVFETPWLVYLSKTQKSGKVFIKENTMVNAYSLLLLGGGTIEVHHSGAFIVLNKWIKFHATPRIAVLIKALRVQLDQLLELKIQQPSLNIAESPAFQIIEQLIQSDGLV
ncbi:DEAD/DEAH box helicase [Pelomyxa schiedti]|nr:DEAD/DEAH box helicase [Pelomyxa schiedti]